MRVVIGQLSELYSAVQIKVSFVAKPFSELSQTGLKFFSK